jgi:hypothetical protein
LPLIGIKRARNIPLGARLGRHASAPCAASLDEGHLDRRGMWLPAVDMAVAITIKGILQCRLEQAIGGARALHFLTRERLDREAELNLGTFGQERPETVGLIAEQQTRELRAIQSADFGQVAA